VPKQPNGTPGKNGVNLAAERGVPVGVSLQAAFYGEVPFENGLDRDGGGGLQLTALLFRLPASLALLLEWIETLLDKIKDLANI
jgi:hypothetical protein